MNVSEVMTADTYVARPDETVQKAAQRMAELDTGVLPVGTADELLGVVTDRDIAIRVVAPGLDAGHTCVCEVMSPSVYCCFADDSVEDAVQRMSDWQVRRLPVLNGARRVVGIVSLGDLARRIPELCAGALQGVSDEDAEAEARYFAPQSGRPEHS